MEHRYSSCKLALRARYVATTVKLDERNKLPERAVAVMPTMFWMVLLIGVASSWLCCVDADPTLTVNITVLQRSGEWVQVSGYVTL